nr:SGNH/GDSL hydrolase family protein [uncultured Actinoplanes sp.]
MIRFVRRALATTAALGLLVATPAPARAEEAATRTRDAATTAQEAATRTREAATRTREAATRTEITTTARPLRIMPLGDSITWGVGTPLHDSYRTDLHHRLTGAGLDVDFVGSQHSGTGPDRDNEGHPGWTIAQISDRIGGWLDAYRPDVILLHIGTNDMTKGLPNATENMAALLGKIHAEVPDAEVFVAKVTGLGHVAGAGARVARTVAFNRSLASLVAWHGPHFHLVDQSRVRGIAITDSVHPNELGFARMSWNWYRALQPILNHSRRAWPAGTDPNRARSFYFCLGDKLSLPPYAVGCHRWYRHSTARVWQLPIRQDGRMRWYTAP